MGHWEDLYYEITESIDKHGLKKEFSEQLKKMSSQDKHKYKDTRDKWTYARTRVIENKKKEKGNEEK